MQINYNNTKVEVPTKKSLQASLFDLGCDRAGVADAPKGEVISRRERLKAPLNEGDSVVVIEIAQGG